MKWKQVFIFIFLVSLFPIGTYFYFQNRYQQIVVIKNQKVSISPTATPTPDPNRDFSILLLGYAGANHDGGFLTDSIILARVSPKLEKIDLISLPRDLWVEIPVSTSSGLSAKLNYAYAVGISDKKFPDKAIEFTGKAGGGEMSKFVVSKITGIIPDYFFALDFTAFTKVVDQLGGLDIQITNTFDDEFYPLEIGTTDLCGKSEEEIIAITATMSGDKLDQQFSCRYEHLHFDKGLVHMDGTTALKFARSRHSKTDGGDFNRSQRQRQVLEAVKEKIISLNFFSKIIPIITTLSYHLTTDMDVKTMESLLVRSQEFSNYKIYSLAITDKNFLKMGTSSNRQSILIPQLGEGNFTDIQNFIKNSDLGSTN
ncbi:MAG TPA: LCP family protein [Candidatus Methanoperedens sp.]|nr:LCP family protein [Candidatus Methanoperedens sp.]